MVYDSKFNERRGSIRLIGGVKAISLDDFEQKTR